MTVNLEGIGHAGAAAGKPSYIGFLLATGVVVGSVALLERVAPQYAMRASVVVLLGVGLVWKDAEGENAATKLGTAIQSGLSKVQAGAGITSGAPSGSIGAGGALAPPARSPAPTNPLPGLNIGSIFGQGGFKITTPFNYGANPGEVYRFGSLTVHRGVDVVPALARGAAQIIGQNVGAPIAGTVAALIPGDAENRGVILRTSNPNVFEHIYHIDSNVRVGQYVPAGGVLGTIANMGGPHVHVEFRDTMGTGGQSFDPTRFLR